MKEHLADYDVDRWHANQHCVEVEEMTGKDDDHKRADKDRLIKTSKEQSVELSEDELGQVDGDPYLRQKVLR